MPLRSLIRYFKMDSDLGEIGGDDSRVLSRILSSLHAKEHFLNAAVLILETTAQDVRLPKF